MINSMLITERQHPLLIFILIGCGAKVNSAGKIDSLIGLQSQRQRTGEVFVLLVRKN